MVVQKPAEADPVFGAMERYEGLQSLVYSVGTVITKDPVVTGNDLFPPHFCTAHQLKWGYVRL